MKKSTSISSQIFDELLTTVEVIGLDKTLQTLKDAKANTNDYNVDFIVSSVSSVTKFPKEKIIWSSDRTDERKVALGLSIYFIKNEFGTSFSALQNIFNLSVSSLSRYCTMIESVPKNPKTDFDKSIVEYIKQINVLIIEKKTKNGK